MRLTSRQQEDLTSAISAYDEGQMTGAEFRSKVEMIVLRPGGLPWMRILAFAVIGSCGGALILASAISLGGDARATVQMINFPMSYLGWAAKVGAVAGAAIALIWKG